MSFLSLASEILLTPCGRSLVGPLLGEYTIAVRGMSYGHEVGQILNQAGIPWCADVHGADDDGAVSMVNVRKEDKERALRVLREHGLKAW